jgi:tetratricopeptide (TPR) repeat protein
MEVVMQDRNKVCQCGSGKKFKRCCLALERKKQSEKSLRVEADTDFITAIYPAIFDDVEQGFTLLNSGDVLEAQEIADSLLEDYFDSYQVQLLSGMCAAKSDNTEIAYSHLMKTIKLFPHCIDAHFNLGILYLKQTRVADAIQSFQKVLEVGDEGEDDLFLKPAATHVERLTKVIEEISGVSIVDYITSSNYFDEAFACLNSNRLEESIELFEKTLAINPNHPQSFGNMALAYLNLGNREVALECIEKALELDPEYEPAIINRRAILDLSEEDEIKTIVVNGFAGAPSAVPKSLARIC